jgi:transcriptional regulator with XRE-family HTH domain
MRRSAPARVRARIEARLKELGMSGVELAKAVRPDANYSAQGSWISGILSGDQNLRLDYLDAIADALNLSPSELIRYDDATLRELTPSEMRLLTHYRNWPRAVQDHWLEMLDYFASTVPDQATAELLEKLRATPRGLRRPVLSWLARLLEEGIPPEAATGGVELSSGEVSTAPDTTHRGLTGRKGRGSR